MQKVSEAVNRGVSIGQNFGKLGTVIENTSRQISGFTGHGIDQVINRNVSPQVLLNTVRNPLVTLQQSGGTQLLLSKQAAVVLNKANEVVTAYGNNLFKTAIQEIVNLSQ